MVLGDKLKRKYWEERGMLGIMAKLAKNHLQGSFNKRKEEDENMERQWRIWESILETKYAEGSRELNILLSDSDGV